MRPRRRSYSSSSYDEHEVDDDYPEIRYVRIHPFAKRDHSYERERPRSHGRDAMQDKRYVSEDSDDDTVHKVDQYGRRYERQHHRPRKHERHAGRRHYPEMSGAISLTPDDGHSHRSASQHLPSKRSRAWSTLSGPFRVNVIAPHRSRKDKHEDCRCRRCNHGRPGSRHDQEQRRSRSSSRSRRSKSTAPRTPTRSPAPKGILRRNSSPGVRPSLRKSVSFETGTKVPFDCESDRTPHGNRERGQSSERSDERRHRLRPREPEVWRETVERWGAKRVGNLGKFLSDP